ncbi:MAG: class II aldolase/adducin family protein [Spirochaetota bacterium]
MKIKRFPYDDFAIDDPAAALTASLQALFHRRDVKLHSASMSVRHAGAVHYLDRSSAANIVLGLTRPEPWSDEPNEITRLESPAAVHGAIYTMFDDIHAVIVGRPPATMALLELGLSLGRPTSMMQKRNVAAPDSHVVRATRVDTTNAERLVREARSRGDAAEMGHLLVIVPGWGLLCAAPNLAEAVAHFDTVEVTARAETARLASQGGRNG